MEPLWRVIKSVLLCCSWTNSVLIHCQTITSRILIFKPLTSQGQLKRFHAFFYRKKILTAKLQPLSGSFRCNFLIDKWQKVFSREKNWYFCFNIMWSEKDSVYSTAIVQLREQFFRCCLHFLTALTVIYLATCKRICRLWQLENLAHTINTIWYLFTHTAVLLCHDLIAVFD